MTPDEVIAFWLDDRHKDLWFERDDAFDEAIRRSFGETVVAAGAGRHDAWADQALGAFALIVVLDQFPRNIHRDSPQAFAYDAKALRVAHLAVTAGFDDAVPIDPRRFFYLPFEHSESLADQERSVALFEAWRRAHDPADRAAVAEAEDQLFFVRRHHEAIARFGRFPHRNAVLGRPSTAAELEFLREPHSSF